MLTDKGLVIHFVEHHGTVISVMGTYKTINEYWKVNGQIFYHKPTEDEVELAYKNNNETKKLLDQ